MQSALYISSILAFMCVVCTGCALHSRSPITDKDIFSASIYDDEEYFPLPELKAFVYPQQNHITSVSVGHSWDTVDITTRYLEEGFLIAKRYRYSFEIQAYEEELLYKLDVQQYPEVKLYFEHIRDVLDSESCLAVDYLNFSEYALFFNIVRTENGPVLVSTDSDGGYGTIIQEPYENSLKLPTHKQHIIQMIEDLDAFSIALFHR